MSCKFVSWIALALTVIGALNWGLWGFFQFDFVAYLFKGNTTAISRIVYSIIGISGLMSLKHLFCCKSSCSHKSKSSCSTDKDKDSCAK